MGFSQNDEMDPLVEQREFKHTHTHTGVEKSERTKENHKGDDIVGIPPNNDSCRRRRRQLSSRLIDQTRHETSVVCVDRLQNDQNILL